MNTLTWIYHYNAYLFQIHKRMLYSGSSDKTARSWVLEFGECTRIYMGHRHTVSSIRHFDGMCKSQLLCISALLTTLSFVWWKSWIIRKLLWRHSYCLNNRLRSGSLIQILIKWIIKQIHIWSLYIYTLLEIGPMCIFFLSNVHRFRHKSHRYNRKIPNVLPLIYSVIITIP